MLSFEVDDAFANAIDSLLKETKSYSSRSEFLKDSVRKNLDAQSKKKRLQEMHEWALSMNKVAKQRAKEHGKKLHMPTYAERDAIALEYLKENGIPVPPQWDQKH